MKILLVFVLLCSSCFAGEVGIETWLQHRHSNYRCGHYEWRSQILRQHWVRLPCGRHELWEDVKYYKVWVHD